jgi:hypothetical protein
MLPEINNIEIELIPALPVGHRHGHFPQMWQSLLATLSITVLKKELLVRTLCVPECAAMSVPIDWRSLFARGGWEEETVVFNLNALDFVGGASQ